MSEKSERLRGEISRLVEEYYQESFQPAAFVPGQSAVPISGRVFDQTELQYLVDSGLDFWLTAGRFATQFEKEFAAWMEQRFAILVNSGSSANLVALSALTSHQLQDKRLKPGDEVITVAAGFPTTVNPIIQNRLVPVFIDVTIPTYNVDISLLEKALSNKTRALIFAHTLGNPFEVKEVADFARRHNLWLIEDCCDAVGAEYQGQKVGTFGDLATVSFYPAHHITMGEGGCVLTNSPKLKTLVESFRDWGRDCWCAPGKDNTCGKRFDWQLGSLPAGYDHKYTYSHIGYNLKLTDMQAAVGVAQLKKLPQFIQARQQNFNQILSGLQDLDEYLVLPQPTINSRPSWFGFPVAVRPQNPATRDDLVRFLNGRKIGTRLLFGGNLVHQPAYKSCEFRTIGDLKNSDFVMKQVFWVGVYPGLTTEMIGYMLESFHAFFNQS